MRLRAELDGTELVVEQDGGFSQESRVILRAVAQDARCEHGTTWRYPYSLGAAVSIHEAADLLHAQLSSSDELEDVVARVKIQTEREWAVRRMIQQYMDSPSMPIAAYAQEVDTPAWRHQKLAYQWALRTDAIYLAHKPGLGKTATGAAIIRGKWANGQVRQPYQEYVAGHWSSLDPSRYVYPHWALRGGVLVVCPKIVLGTWRDELMRWQGLQAMLILGSRHRKEMRAARPYPVHVCTYDSLDVLEDNEYDGIVADEAHYLANEDTKRYAKALHLRNKAKWVVAMSGTPVSNMLPSLWAQYFWLDGGRTLGPSFEQYRRRYFDGSGRKLEPRPSAADNIAKQVGRVTYFLTMQEAFPDRDMRKVQQVSKIPMTREQVSYYRQLRNTYKADILTGQVTTDGVNERMIKLLQVCQGFVKADDGQEYEFTSAKLDALKGMITGAGDLTDRKTIVWCRFRRDLVRIVRMLREADIECLFLHGSQSNKERERIRDIWNHDTRYRVLVGMIQIGIGVNLHAPNCVDQYGVPDRCSTTVFFGLDWRVTQLEQAMDRTYRGDQVETCLYRYLLSEDINSIMDEDGNDLSPLDVQVYETLQLKLEQAAEISEESVEYIRRLLAA